MLINAIFTNPCKFVSPPTEEATSPFVFSWNDLIWFWYCHNGFCAIHAGVTTQQDGRN